MDERTDGDDDRGAPTPDPWLAFDQAVRDRHGVADASLAAAHGVNRSRFHRRTGRESWAVPRDGIRLHPHVPDSVQQRLTVVTVRTVGLAAASRDTAAWLRGLQAHPPAVPTIALAQPYRAQRHRDVHIHRARWLTPDDVTEVQRVATLTVPAMLLSSARAPEDRQRARLIDVLYRGLASTEDILGLLERAGPVPGKSTLRRLCHRIGPLVVESVFQNDVATTLLSLGYPAEQSTRRIDTADGRGLTVDVALVPWKIALETDGDAFHRTREQRRLDRRRLAAYAGTDWAPVPIDWRDWLEDRDHVLAAIDAAIEAQRRRGLGRDRPPPRTR